MQVTFPVHTVVFTLEYFDLYDMLITFAVNSIMTQTDYRKVLFIFIYTVDNDCTWMQIIFIDLQRCCFVKLAVRKDYSCFLSLTLVLS